MKIRVRSDLGAKSFQKSTFVVVSLLLTFLFYKHLFIGSESNIENYHKETRGVVFKSNVGTNSNFVRPATRNRIAEKWEPYLKKELITHLQTYHLTPPASLNEPYNLSVNYPHYNDHNLYHVKLLQILKKYHLLESGFFVEAGALDGHYLSHSLDLEIMQKWNGLLVEASPNLTRQLRSKKRKCWSANVCLTGEPYMKIDYMAKKDQQKAWKRGNGKINPLKYGIKPRQFEGEQAYQSEGEVECFSLFSLLTALNVTMVDLLVLDIEGHEFQVLSNYPFDLIPIKVVAVEHWMVPVGSVVLKTFMLQKGYMLVFQSASDYVFVLKT